MCVCVCYFMSLYLNIFYISFISDAEGNLTAAFSGHIYKSSSLVSVGPTGSISAVILLVHLPKRCLLSSLCLRHFTTCHWWEHICISRHLPWIACVRVRAWAGHRPLPENSSHLDSLSWFPVIFFFFLLWSYFLFLTFVPGMDVPEAGKHVKKSTSQKLEDQKKVIIFFFALSLCCCGTFLFFYLVMFVLPREDKKNNLAWVFLFCIHIPALGCETRGKQLLLYNCCFCIATWCCVSYVLIAIYKDLGACGPLQYLWSRRSWHGNRRGAWVGAGPNLFPMGRHIYSLYAMLFVLAEDG